MEPIKNLSAEECRNIKYVLCDLDDTLTLDGTLPASAYKALEDLEKSGHRVIVVTGRPAGWCDLIARIWPITAVVGENGAYYFTYDRKSRTMIRRYQRDEQTRDKDRVQLFDYINQLKNKYPFIELSADQPYRISDVAIDFCEDVDPWKEEDIYKISDELSEMGATVKVSSIHINAWIGSFSKLEMARKLLKEELGLNDEQILSNCIYAGDSPNDEPMFEHFPMSFGVANVMNYTKAMEHLPRWVTEKQGGEGFAEFVTLLMSKKST